MCIYKYFYMTPQERQEGKTYFKHNDVTAVCKTANVSRDYFYKWLVSSSKENAKLEKIFCALVKKRKKEIEASFSKNFGSDLNLSA